MYRGGRGEILMLKVYVERVTAVGVVCGTSIPMDQGMKYGIGPRKSGAHISKFTS